MFNPYVGTRARISEVSIAKRVQGATGPESGDYQVVILGLETPDPTRPMHVNLWLASWNNPEEERAFVRGYDLVKRNGVIEFFGDHPWGHHPKPPQIMFKHNWDALDLTGQFAWRRAQRHPLWMHGPHGAYASQAKGLPACAIREGDLHRWALHLTEVKASIGSTPGSHFRFQAEDLKNQPWHGYLDLATKDGLLWKGLWPRTEATEMR